MCRSSAKDLEEVLCTMTREDTRRHLHPRFLRHTADGMIQVGEKCPCGSGIPGVISCIGAICFILGERMKANITPRHALTGLHAPAPMQPA